MCYRFQKFILTRHTSEGWYPGLQRIHNTINNFKSVTFARLKLLTNIYYWTGFWPAPE